MDCMDYMAQFPDNYFDLAIVDPPYGISINMNMGRKKGEPQKHDKKNLDDSIPNSFYFSELFRVSKNQVIFGGNYFLLPITKSWIFWDKEVPQSLSFACGELAWTSFDKTLIKVNVPYNGFVGSEGRIHPTQKPVKLYEWLLKNYAKDGDKILDTHLGSASSAIAAHRMGFEFFGTELDSDYFQASIARFERETAQLDMFAQETE